jgi:hypothetical protein
MKVSYSTDNICAFGGLNFTDKLLKNQGIFDVIDNSLVDRGLLAHYSYSDLIRSLLSLRLCGGTCAEDITEHLHSELQQIPDFNVCSADTLLRMQKELATDKEVYISDSHTVHEFNINIQLNELLVELLINTGQLDINNQGYVLDYDNQFIPTGKFDSKLSYKKVKGYFPGIASIDNAPVYIENRNGNSNVKYKQDQTLIRAYKILNDQKVKVKHSRMDCGSFTHEVVKVVEQNSEFFYIRAQRCGNLFEQLEKIEKWQSVTINNKKCEIASILYSPFGKKSDKEYRYVISREPRADGQTDIFTKDNYTYRAIMTNNNEMSDLKVIIFYNQRGESERVFDEMNNDFLWNKLPFSFLEENTVFLILMAICRNLYHFLLEAISKKVEFVKSNFRIKKFIFRFMIVPAKWIKQARTRVLKLFSKKQYHILI